MGGLISVFCGTISPYSPNIIPCIAPHSATSVFCDGILKNYVDWKGLAKSLPENQFNHKSIENAQQFMKKLFDDLTDVRQYPKPSNPKSSIIVSAEYDQYAPLSWKYYQNHWDNAEVRWVFGAGHITSILLHQPFFVKTICDSFKKNSNL